MKSKGTFPDLISKSPFGPIQVHMDKSKECAEELLVLIDAAIKNDWDKATVSRRKIKNLEREADSLKAETRRLLPKGLFLFVPRRDLLDLIGLADEIPNTIKDISGLVFGRRMIIPPQISSLFIEFTAEAVAVVNTAASAIDQLSEVSRLAFGSRSAGELDKIISSLDVLEAESDRSEITLRRQLFDIEKDLPPIDVIFLYEVINEIGKLADRAQQVGHRLALISVK